MARILRRFIEMTVSKFPILTVQDLSVVFPDNNGGLNALDDVSFEVCPQEFICFLGPSGSGKTTLLRILAGLLRPTEGQVHFVRSQQPKIGMVFQQSNLMPWRTVMDNIKLPLELEGMGESKARVRAQEMIELVGLQGFEDNWPRDLSGGMAQRVALARALIHDPDLLLLDEPFGSLDAITRERMWTELSRIWQARQPVTDGPGKTVIMVTHSINESLFLADRVLVLTQRPGRVKLDLKVDLPRPRKEDIRYTPHFGKLARKLREAIE
ncbi:MAG: ABC transporter ATP-binding protein [Chloroflexi bacterium]|nr:ABC transporter ATP-binding protein [Chloroflexota bacterium]